MTTDVTNHPHFQKLQREGISHIDHSSRKTVYVDGVRYEEITVSDRPEPLKGKIGMAKRIGLGAVGLLGTVANISKDFRRATLETAWNGRAEEKVLYNKTDPMTEERRAEATDGRSRNALEQRLGYDPKNRASIKAYLERPEIRKQLLSDGNGNYMLPEHRRDGTSSFLFVPNGDFNKATSIKISTASSGEQLKGAEFHKAMLTYGSQYEDMIKGRDQKADELAVQLGKKRGLNDDQIEAQKEELKKKVLKHMHIAVISPKGNHTRFYSSNVDPNAKDIFGRRAYANSLTGTRIDWSDSTKKDVAQTWKKGPEDKLTKERPFENGPPEPAPHREDEDESSRALHSARRGGESGAPSPLLLEEEEV